MPRVSPTAGFEKYLSELLAKRKEYQKGLDEIDALFGKWGVVVGAPAAARGPVAQKSSGSALAAPRAGGRRGPRRGRKYGQTAEQFILSLLSGGKGLETAAINGAWKEAGRGGRSDQTLAKMVKARKLKRVNVPGIRGSRYTAA
jgi:hypothetical protein